MLLHPQPPLGRGGQALATLLLMTLTPTASVLTAQQDPPTAAQSKQQLAEGKFKELTDRMQKLMVVLQKDEPEESKLLGAGLRYREMPVSYRKRIGKSKISGTLSGSVRAGWKILYTIFRLYFAFTSRRAGS